MNNLEAAVQISARADQIADQPTATQILVDHRPKWQRKVATASSN
jgi:hypothetical protein